MDIVEDMAYAAVIEPFSDIWIKTSSICVGVLIFSFFIMVYAPKKWLKYLGLLFLMDVLFAEVVYWFMGDWNIYWALPLQYCTIMEIFAGIALITRWQWVFEMVLFLGALGPIQALIAPAFPYEGIYFRLDFYFAHTIPLLAPLLLMIKEQMRPRPHAWWKSCVRFLVFTVVIFYFDYFIDANYMFLMEMPPLDHPLIGLGEWPQYIFFGIGIFVLWSGMINLFFWVPRKWYSAHQG